MSDQWLCVVEIPLTRQEMRLVGELTVQLGRANPAQLVREALGLPREPPPGAEHPRQPARRGIPGDQQSAEHGGSVAAAERSGTPARARPGALRAALLAELAAGPRSGEALAQATAAKPAALRYNLLRLQRIGLLTVQGEGREALYTLVDRPLEGARGG